MQRTPSALSLSGIRNREEEVELGEEEDEDSGDEVEPSEAVNDEAAVVFVLLAATILERGTQSLQWDRPFGRHICTSVRLRSPTLYIYMNRK
jgi:hypothetical protein